MLITNLTDVDYWFGPMRLPAAASGFYLDDTSDTALYLLNDEVADAVNTLYLSSNITVSSAASPFPRPTGTPSLLHGDGSPEGLVYAPGGSLYMRRDSVQPSTALYTKTTGVTVNTGWISVIAPTMQLLQETTLETAVATINFSAIPQSYSHLKVIMSTSTTTHADVHPWLCMQINLTDTQGSYYNTQVTVTTDTIVTPLWNPSAEVAWVGQLPFFGASAGTEINLMGYTNPVTVPFTAVTGLSDSGGPVSFFTAGAMYTQDLGGTGITSLQFSLYDDDDNAYDFAAGSVATLYGLGLGNAG